MLFRSSDFEVISAPLNDLAMELGDSRLINMVALGIYASRFGAVKITSLADALPQVLPERNHRFIPGNIKAVEAGAAFDRRGKQG